MSSQWKRRKMMHMRAKKKEEEEKAIAASLSEEYKETIRKEAYLGKKGYTIPKAAISEEDMKHLYESLRVAPVTSGVVYNAHQNDGAFPVYRENAKKMYIPRFYGIDRYGLPHRCEIEEGDNIHVDFPKPLRDYQDKIAQRNGDMSIWTILDNPFPKVPKKSQRKEKEMAVYWKFRVEEERRSWHSKSFPKYKRRPSLSCIKNS